MTKRRKGIWTVTRSVFGKIFQPGRRTRSAVRRRYEVDTGKRYGGGVFVNGLRSRRHRGYQVRKRR